MYLWAISDHILKFLMHNVPYISFQYIFCPRKKRVIKPALYFLIMQNAIIQLMRLKRFSSPCKKYFPHIFCNLNVILTIIFAERLFFQCMNCICQSILSSITASKAWLLTSYLKTCVFVILMTSRHLLRAFSLYIMYNNRGLFCWIGVYTLCKDVI